MTLAYYTTLSFPKKDAHFLLPGPAGDLEVRTSPGSCSAPQGIGVICHPHPLMGGTMDNKVVCTISRAFKEIGYAAVRFNFRGVGFSTGQYNKGQGELLDLLAILKWLNVICTDSVICLAGFSFGSFIAASAAKQWDVQQLVLVAPPVERFNFQALTPFSCPWAVIQGEQDEVVTPDAVFNWLDSLSPAVDQYRLAGAGHFFHGQLSALRQLLVTILKREA